MGRSLKGNLKDLRCRLRVTRIKKRRGFRTGFTSRLKEAPAGIDKKKAHIGVMRAFLSCAQTLFRDNVYSLCAFFILCNLKLDGLTLPEGLKTLTLNSRVMNKDIFTAFLLDETIALYLLTELTIRCL
jgi:hypothetical protein